MTLTSGTARPLRHDARAGLRRQPPRALRTANFGSSASAAAASKVAVMVFPPSVVSNA
jgi:hypothetical protein